MKFKERGWMQGLAVNQHGTAEGSMGVAYGDVDGDGHSDLMVTNYYTEINTLFRYDRDGVFEDRTTWRMGLGPATKNMVAWGTQFVDFNNDSWLDLFCTNGHVDNLEKQTQLNYGMKAQVFINQGKGVFEEVTEQSGDYFQDRWVGRGAAFGDIDNDGDMDVVVTNNGGAARLLLNNVGNQNHWLGLRLVGGSRPRDMLGARVGVFRPDGPTLWRRSRTDGSYASAHDPRVLVGLGRTRALSRVRVIWPSGHIEEWTNLSINQWVTLTQGTGRAVEGEQ